MSQSRKKPAQKRNNQKKKAPQKFQWTDLLTQKNLIIAGAAAIVVVAIILLIVFLPKKPPVVPAATTPVAGENPTGPSAQSIVENAPGQLTLFGDINLTIGYDANGNALAVIGDSETANKIAESCPKFAGLPCSEAIAIILPVLANEHVQFRSHISIRQEQGSPNPSENFMKEIREAAKASVEVPVMIISISDMDEHGYFNLDTAKRALRAAKGDHVEILRITDLYEGTYLATLKEGEAEVDYEIGALSGYVKIYEEIVDEPGNEIPDDSMNEEASDNPNETLEEEEEESAEDEKKDETTEEKEEPAPAA